MFFVVCCAEVGVGVESVRNSKEGWQKLCKFTRILLLVDTLLLSYFILLTLLPVDRKNEINSITTAIIYIPITNIIPFARGGVVAAAQ